VIAPLSYLGPMALSWPFRDDVIRFSLPVIPFGIAVIVISAGIITSRWIPQFKMELPTNDR